MPTNDEVYGNYLRDLGCLIRDLAGEAKREEETTAEGLDKVYKTGYLMGFHTVVSLMQQQARAFQIPLSDLCLDGIDPEKDLL